MTARAHRATVRSLGSAALAAAAVPVLVLATSAPAQAAHPGTARFGDRQVVQLTDPGAQRGRGSLDLHLTGQDAVVADNLAVASTSCDGCRATAISFQVVVSDLGPSSVQATNVALADNTGCAGCEADAYAYQFVLAFVGNARLSGAGHRALDDVDAGLARLARSGASAADLQAQVDAYASQVVTVLGSELRVRPVLRTVHRVQRGPAAVA